MKHLVNPAAVLAAMLSLGSASATCDDTAAPQPVFDRNGSALTFDFPDLHIGVAEYDEGPTGTTVFYFPDGVKAAVDVRGGSPGTVNAAALMNARDAKMMDLVVFSGGSWYGLSATTGAANELQVLMAEAEKPNFIAGAVGAIIYDVGGRRMTRITPDDRLGRAAMRAARSGVFPLGARGAGRFAMQGYYHVDPLNARSSADWPHSGQGGAFRQVGPTKIAVFTVVNSLGAVVDRDGRVVRCARNDTDRECPHIDEWLVKSKAPAADNDRAQTGNTTLTLVVINQKLAVADLQRIAKQVHGAMSRAIQPFATQEDGDVLYAVTTEQVENPDLHPVELAVIASELAWDAVLASVPELPTPASPSGERLDAITLESFVGDYEFTDFSRVAIRVEEGRLVARYGGISQIYFWSEVHELLPAGPNRFVIDLPARDLIAFEQGQDGAMSLILNPGPWAQRARRAD